MSTSLRELGKHRCNIMRYMQPRIQSIIQSDTTEFFAELGDDPTGFREWDRKSHRMLERVAREVTGVMFAELKQEPVSQEQRQAVAKVQALLEATK